MFWSKKRRFWLFSRAWLGILVAQHVLPIWEMEHSGEKKPHSDIELPQKWLFLAEGVLNNNIDREKAQIRGERDFQNWKIANREQQWHTANSVNAALSAFAALLAAIGKDPFENIIFQDNEIDPIDPYKSSGADAALYASAAYSGEFDCFDESRSLEFWEWWLTRAIPQTWELTIKSISTL